MELIIELGSFEFPSTRVVRRLWRALLLFALVYTPVGILGPLLTSGRLQWNPAFIAVPLWIPLLVFWVNQRQSKVLALTPKVLELRMGPYKERILLARIKQVRLVEAGETLQKVKLLSAQDFWNLATTLKGAPPGTVLVETAISRYALVVAEPERFVEELNRRLGHDEGQSR